ncbi:FAD-dependent oxidoreductase [Nocardia jiangxiensis]|uniref:FAD-dependent oxidoreductase n=1 Tax=Nocardia jiangxiensis TaxID=282685 RepID=UPI0002EE2047|nr:FAD-dependent monooxygenase [Nocardia jiangxiensis]
MVSVIGGGIAGSCLAGGLAREGHPVAIYEQQHPGPGAGAFLFIDGRGHDAMEAMGVDRSALQEVSYPLEGLDYEDSRGRRSAMPSRGHRFWLRRNLMGVLSEFVADSPAELCYGAPISSVTSSEDSHAIRRGADVVAAEGLLVGADGIDSVVRAGLEPGRTPVYAGDVVLYGMTGTPLDPPPTTDPAVLHFFAEVAEDGSAGSTFGHIWRPQDPAALWFVRIPREPLPGTRDDIGMRPVDEWAETVLAATPSSQSLVSAFLARTEVVHVSNARNVSLEQARAPQDSVVLIGDADHAITPAAGVGARDALEDARAVFDAIIGADSPAEAMTQRRKQILTDREAAQRARRR